MQEGATLAQARRGDSDAFERLVTPYERKLYAVCLRMMASEQDAQDALQDAMLRMWRGLPDFDERSRFATWAYRVTTNACLDALRKQKNRAASSLEALEEGGYLPEDPADSPEEAVIRSTRRQAVQDALAELPPDARAALVLRDIQGESYEQVAEALGLTLGTAKSRIHRAREKLAGILAGKPELFEPDRVQRSVQSTKDDASGKKKGGVHDALR
ncbi:MAG: sigma-70 family RNA polymerase sigma factor [Clostridia bacterium]|nr:sigma-70 family RNA polymerase sigma factor [Clostridia bacterium]